MCHAQDQYGDNCGSAARSTRPPTSKPFSALDRRHPVLQEFRALLLPAVRPRCVDFLQAWTQDGRLQPEVANKVKEWFTVRTNGRQPVEGLGDWDISATRPTSASEIPNAPGQVFLRLAGRAHRLPGLAEEPAGQVGPDYDD